MRDATPYCVVAIAFVAITATLASQTSVTFIPDVPPTLGPGSIPLPQQDLDFSRYLHDLFRPGALAGIIGGSVMDQLRHSQNGPPELGDKIAEKASRRAVVVSVRDGMAALMHLEPSNRYQFCHCQGFGRRVGHALLESFTAHKDDGGRALAIPRFASAYAGSMTQLAWTHDRTAGQVALRTTMSFGVSALMNVVKEFSPAWRVRLPLLHREVVLPFGR